MKVQFGYEYKHCTADTAVKNIAGVLHSVVINKAATTAGVITLYDNTAESGTVIAAITVTKSDASQAPVTLIYDLRFATGLYAGFDGTIQGADITITYV